MNRTEATDLLKEIIEVCDGLAEQGVMLMPPNSDDVLSHGYQLHIKSLSHQQIAPCIKTLVEKHNLAIADEPEKGLIIIYRPMKAA